MADFQPVGVTATVRGFSTFITQMGAVSTAIRGSGVAGVAASVGMGALRLAFTAIAVAATAVIGALTAIIGAIAGLGFAAVKTTISVEDAFAGVLKTTQTLGTNFYALTDAGKQVFAQFRALATQVPLTFEALANIGQLGGQLGIPEMQIASFTKTVASIGYSTNLSYEEAALGLARLAAVFKIATDDIAANVERQASALVYLGNNYAATEQEILLGARNIAGAAAIAQMTQADIFGISTAFTIAGVRAEAGGTAVQNAIVTMQQAVNAGAGTVDEKWNGVLKQILVTADTNVDDLAKIVFEGGDALEEFSWRTGWAVDDIVNALSLGMGKQGTEELKLFADTAGLTEKEFVELWKTDAGEAFRLFVAGLGTDAENATTILDELGLGSARSLRTFTGLANNTDVLTAAMNDANMAFEQNTALTREASIRFETLKSQFQILKNVIRDVVIEIGLQLMPAFDGLLEIDFTAWGNGIKAAIPGAFSTIATAVSDAWENDIKPAIENIFNISIPTIDLSTITSVDIQTFIENLSTSISQAITDVGNFITKISELKTSILGDGKEAFNELTRILNEEVLPAMQPVVDGLNLIWFVMSADFPQMKEETRGFGQTFVEEFSNTIPQALATFGITLDAFAVFWHVWGGQMVADSGTTSNLIVQTFFRGIAGLAILFSFGLTTILGILSAFGLMLQGQWQAGWDLLLVTLGNVGILMAAIISNTMNIILGIFGIHLADYGPLWYSAMQDIINAITVSGQGIIEEFNTIIQWAKDTILNAGWYNVGASIVSGIVAGIKDGAGAVADAISSLTGGGGGGKFSGATPASGGLIGTGMRQLQINTPSKVFMAMGESIVEGLAMGMGNSGLAETAAQNMVGSVMAMASGSMPASAMGSSSTDRSFNPTINANYYKTQNPQDIAGDLALINAVRG